VLWSSSKVLGLRHPHTPAERGLGADDGDVERGADAEDGIAPVRLHGRDPAEIVGDFDAVGAFGLGHVEIIGRALVRKGRRPLVQPVAQPALEAERLAFGIDAKQPNHS
jgi:hypothetical protein